MAIYEHGITSATTNITHCCCNTIKKMIFGLGKLCCIAKSTLTGLANVSIVSPDLRLMNESLQGRLLSLSRQDAIYPCCSYVCIPTTTGQLIASNYKRMPRKRVYLRSRVQARFFGSFGCNVAQKGDPSEATKSRYNEGSRTTYDRHPAPPPPPFPHLCLEAH